MRTALVIPTAADPYKIDLSEGSLEKLQSAVGGYIQMVEIGPYSMYLNEEGKMIGLPVNRLATALWESEYGAGTDIIVGNAVFCGPPDDEGEDTSLSIDQFYEFAKERVG